MILRLYNIVIFFVLKMSSHAEKSYINRRHINPSAERNKAPILEVLRKHMIRPQTHPPANQTLLEIASGSGQHIVYLAKHFPWITFQPTESDMTYFESILGYIEYDKVTNVKPPGYLDVSEAACSWLGGKIKNDSLDYVLCINMIHITDIKCTEGLFHGCGEVLKPGGFLFTYGPYAFDGKITPDSNTRFDWVLRSQNSSWGLRDVKLQLEPLAGRCGLQLVKIQDLPSNNHLIAWQKVVQT